MSALLEIRPSLRPVKPIYILALAAALAVLMFDLSPWLIIAPALIACWAAAKHIARRFAVMRVTGDKLRFESGMLSKSTRTIQLSKIQDVRVEQSLGQRILGIGSITIETAGETSQITMQGIDRPQQVADALLDTVHKSEGKATG
jgi:uncharacterized membrane protein YdbT with pleckstrin-like domain